MENGSQKSGVQYRDGFIRALLHDEERAIEACNAVVGTSFPKGTPVRFFTGGEATILRRRGDVAFAVGNILLVFFEHQWTLSPNIPFRMLRYYADTVFTWLTDKEKLYTTTLITLPTPKFFMFYNGKEKLENDLLYLSDAFEDFGGSKDFSMELTVKIIDIRHGSGNEVLRKSETLNGYAYLIARIEENERSGKTRDNAIKEAVEHCIENGVLAEFLKNNFKEVCDMLTWEIDEEKVKEYQKEAYKEEGRKEGRKEGREKGRVEGLLESAIKLLKKGMNMDTVADMLELEESQITQLKQMGV